MVVVAERKKGPSRCLARIEGGVSRIGVTTSIGSVGRMVDEERHSEWCVRYGYRWYCMSASCSREQVCVDYTARAPLDRKHIFGFLSLPLGNAIYILISGVNEGM